jgi:hypothetical protein
MPDIVLQFSLVGKKAQSTWLLLVMPAQENIAANEGF